MSKPNDGGPAFPECGTENGFFNPGMSLRDYFAAAALQGMLTDVPHEDRLKFPEYAQDAYRYADAMLEARKLPV